MDANTVAFVVAASLVPAFALLAWGCWTGYHRDMARIDRDFWSNLYQETYKDWTATTGKLEAAEAEIARLKRGDFTPEEFQNLCHNRHESPGCTRADFEAGCVQFQEKLFGPAPQPPADPNPFPLTGPVPSILADVAGEEPCCECGDPYPRADLVVRGEIYCAKCRAPAE